MSTFTATTGMELPCRDVTESGFWVRGSAKDVCGISQSRATLEGPRDPMRLPWIFRRFYPVEEFYHN